MVKHSRVVLAAAVCAATQLVSATDFTGIVQQLNVRQGTAGARVTFSMAGLETGCAGQGSGSYAFDNADVGLGKVWSSQILLAYTQGKAITVWGTGDCVVFQNPDNTTTPGTETVKMLILRESGE